MEKTESSAGRQLSVLRLLGQLIAENTPGPEIAEILAMNFEETEIREAIRVFLRAARKGCKHDPHPHDPPGCAPT